MGVKITKVTIYCDGTQEGVQKMGINLEFDKGEQIEEFIKICQSSNQKQFFRADKICIIIGKAVITQN